MPSFTFTSPDGKNYTVDGPEGATKEQAFQMLQQQIGGKQAAAPTTPYRNPAASTEASVPGTKEAQTLGSAARDIGVSTGAGAALGALAPEIAMGLGAAATSASNLPFPAAKVLAPVGAGLMATGEALRGSRIIEAGAGALSGLISESAGQIADLVGAGKGTATAVRLGAGIMSPGASSLAGFVSKSGKTLFNLVQKVAGQDVSNIPKAVTSAKALLASPAVAGQPELAVHEALAKGAAHTIQAAEDAARAGDSEAFARAASVAKTDPIGAQSIINEARQRGAQLRTDAAKQTRVLNDATNGVLQTAARVHASASKELAQTVAPAREASDIGNELRSKVTAEQQQALGARSAAYQAKQQERDAVVAQKEASGLTVDSVPAMKSLKQDIEKKLLLTQKGQAAAKGMAPVTEQGVMQGYQRVYDAISNRKVQTGVDATGTPQYQTFKTTFDALDHVRRKLGDAAFGKDVEGYAGIGQSIAKDLYGKISKIQEEYAGPAQKELQEGYHEATQGLAKFGSGAGKKLTAVDRVDPEAFAKDPASIPGTFFKSQQSVKDLTELTGDKALVANAAHSYAARQLEGKSAKQVAQWHEDNKDWIREVPGLAQKVDSYGKRLTTIEKTRGALTEASARIGKQAAAAYPAAVKESEKLVGEARKAVEARAQSVVKEGFPAEATKKLLQTGTPEELATASRYLAGAPGGKAALEGSVRNYLAGMGEKDLATKYRDRIVPMLKEGGLLPQEAMAKLDIDVQRVLKAYVGPEQRSALRKVVMAALTTAGASMGAGIVRKIAGVPQ